MLAGEPRLKLQDVAGRVVALGLPCSHCLFGSKQAREIDMRPVTAPQRTSTKPVSDVKSPVSIFNLSRPIDLDSGVQTVPAHTFHSRPYPEQVDVEPRKLNAGNTAVSATFPVNVPFLPTALFFGRVEEQFRLVGAVTNDNWHPLGAA